MKLVRPLVVFDLETTGIWIEKDRIIEIGMIKITPDGKEELYATKVNPCMPIPPVVTELTGISDADVKSAPPFGTIAGKVCRARRNGTFRVRREKIFAAMALE